MKEKLAKNVIDIFFCFSCILAISVTIFVDYFQCWNNDEIIQSFVPLYSERISVDIKSIIVLYQ